MEHPSPISIIDGSPPVVRGNMPLTLSEIFDRLRLNIGKGWMNDVRIQREVTIFIADECGSDLNEYVNPTNSDCVLGPIFERARDKYIPMSSIRTIRRCFMFFLEQRVTMAERRKEFFVRRKRCARRDNKQKRRLYFNYIWILMHLNGR